MPIKTDRRPGNQPANPTPAKNRHPNPHRPSLHKETAMPIKTDRRLCQKPTR